MSFLAGQEKQSLGEPVGKKARGWGCPSLEVRVPRNRKESMAVPWAERKGVTQKEIGDFISRGGAA